MLGCEELLNLYFYVGLIQVKLDILNIVQNLNVSNSTENVKLIYVYRLITNKVRLFKP